MAAQEMREEMHGNEELGSCRKREQERGICVGRQLCGKGLELGGGITFSSDSVAPQLWVTLDKSWGSHTVKAKSNVGNHANPTI